MTFCVNVLRHVLRTSLARFKLCRGDLLESQAAALVNPVNCLGVAGSGLAETFKFKYPGNNHLYVKACRKKQLKIGTILPVLIGQNPDRYIVNFPTKIDWRNPSRYTYIISGLKVLALWMKQNNIPSVAIPKLGCGLGGLDWTQVETDIRQHLDDVEAEIELYV